MLNARRPGGIVGVVVLRPERLQPELPGGQPTRQEARRIAGQATAAEWVVSTDQSPALSASSRSETSAPRLTASCTETVSMG